MLTVPRDMELVGWIAGRWQPWAKHHVKVCNHALEVLAQEAEVELENAALGVGIRVLPRSQYNPFIKETRASWISESSDSFVPFYLERKVRGAKAEIIDQIGNAPLFTREKAWARLTKWGLRLPVVYEKRTGEAATNIRAQWFAGDSTYAKLVPAHVAVDMTLFPNEEKLYLQELKVSKFGLPRLKLR
jgi:hypothetical protein